ncbi:hypothetical protein EVA_10778, partial [gut metagenome]
EAYIGVGWAPFRRFSIRYECRLFVGGLESYGSDEL